MARQKRIFPGVAVAVGIIVTLAAMAAYRPVLRWLHHRGAAVAGGSQPAPLAAVLEPGLKDALRITPEALDRLGIRTVAAKPSDLGDGLNLQGTLGIDPARLQEVRPRFRGEIVELGKSGDGDRTLQFGDAVKKGQLLAVLWSRELGEKKSELIDALVQLDLDAATLKRLEPLAREGSVPEREFREAARAVEVDNNAVARISRTLHMWRVGEDELQAVQTEANRLIAERTPAPAEDASRWARSEIRAALDGVLLELNAAVGDVVSQDDVLFKVGDLARLQVVAFAYEEDLPRLDRLPQQGRDWTIAVPAAPEVPPQTGAIDRLGQVVDPVQHTVAVMGWADNSQGLLRAGQFVSAAVQLPPPEGEIAVPATAIVEKGGEKLLFVQQGDDLVFAERRVAVSRVVGKAACIWRKPPAAADADVAGLEPGERVVSSGAVELQQALVDLQAAQPPAAKDEADAP
jgi:cobalt-zinc-cadmium efflux system membrane fusion protein